MVTVILAIVIFGTVAWLVQQLQKRFTYAEGWWKYVSIFSFFSLLILWVSATPMMPYISTVEGFVLSAAALVIFLLLEVVRGMRWLKHDYLGAESLPQSYHGLLRPGIRDSSAKAAEVLFQDCAALVILVNLATLYGLSVAIAAFSVVVFLVHLPGVYYFGKTYGTLFLVVSTVAAPIVAYFVIDSYFALHILFTAHLLSYPVMMYAMRILKKRV